MGRSGGSSGGGHSSGGFGGGHSSGGFSGGGRSFGSGSSGYSHSGGRPGPHYSGGYHHWGYGPRPPMYGPRPRSSGCSSIIAWLIVFFFVLAIFLSSDLDNGKVQKSTKERTALKRSCTENRMV